METRAVGVAVGVPNVLQNTHFLLFQAGNPAPPVLRLRDAAARLPPDPLLRELQEEYKLPILGEVVSRCSNGWHKELVESLYEARGELPVVKGKTMSCDCFYEGQGRLDGSICEYTAEDKMRFLNKVYDLGVRNIEMESCYLGAFGKRVGLPVACVCSCLLNRLEGDQVTSTPEQLGQYVQRSVDLVIAWLHKYLLDLCSDQAPKLAVEPPAGSASPPGGK